MRKKKKSNNILQVILLVIVLEAVLAMFAGTSFHIGRNPQTGSFGVWKEVNNIGIIDNIKVSIKEGLLPDEYVKENNIKDPEKYTWGSQKIYKFFMAMFHEKSPIKFFGGDSAILNFRLWRMLLFVNIFILLGAFYIRKKLHFIPTKVQIVAEMFYDFFDNLVGESVGHNNKRFVPYFLTIFVFVWLANWSCLLPIPGISAPTSNLNAPLGLGIMALVVVHVCSFRKKGIVGYCKGLCEPFVAMLPMNIVGELSKMVSVSFRLFGNIFGGAIITVVISALTINMMIPIVLNMYFTLFAGTIQAFVFTMLTMSYLSLEISDV